MINKTITHLSLRAAALLTLMLLTILTAPTEARAQYSMDFYTLILDDNYVGGGTRTLNIQSDANITPTAPTCAQGSCPLVHTSRLLHT